MSAAINKSSVIDFVDNVERQAFTAIKECATEHPNAARIFSVAVAIERLARAILLAPAVFLEKIVLIGKSVKEYLSTADQNQKKLHLDECKTYAVGALKTLFIAAPVSLVYNAMLAVADSIQMAKDPLQCATYHLDVIGADNWVKTTPENKMIANSLDGIAGYIGTVLSAAGVKVPLP